MGKYKEKIMKEIVVISGKGGTGKTSFSAAFAKLNNTNAVACDCDVDAANLHMLLGSSFENEVDFKSGHEANIAQEECITCGKCMRVCRFGAIEFVGGKYIVKPYSCEGCHYCATICPTGAIEMELKTSGHSYCSKTDLGQTLVHAKLAIGAEMSGKLIAHTKERARVAARKEGAKYLIVDGSPGIGCPVVSSLSGANLALFVAEASISGFHDLKRVHKLTKTFNIPSVMIINKSDLNDEIKEELIKFAKENEVEIVGEMEYKKEVYEALQEGKTLLDKDELKEKIVSFWQKIEDNLKEKR